MCVSLVLQQGTYSLERNLTDAPNFGGGCDAAAATAAAAAATAAAATTTTTTAAAAAAAAVLLPFVYSDSTTRSAF